MRLRLGSLVLGCMLLVATMGGIGIPAGVLAATSYTTCPTFGQFQSDVQAISGTATFTFVAADCTLVATSTIVTQDASTVTINGNGLTLSAGTADAPGTFDVLIVGNFYGSLTLNHTTLEYGRDGITCPESGCANIAILNDSTVRGNSGRGIALGNTTLTSSTISDNGDYGVASSNVTATNSTISNNGNAGIRSSNLTVINSTIDNNGIGIISDDATIAATVLSGNLQNCFVGFPRVDQGYNLSTDDSCDFSATGSQNSVTTGDLQLGTLGNYGGPTETIPLLSGSIAIDAIPTGTVSDQIVCLNANNDAILDPTTSQPIVTDQRGVVRPQGIKCDIGAYEQGASTTTASNATAVDTATSVTLTATVTSSNGVVNEGTVTFSLTDASSNPVGTAVQGTVANGSASASFDVTGLAPGNYAITASYHDSSGLFPDSQDTTHTLMITAGSPTHVTLDPGDTSATVGVSVTETATVTDQQGNPVADGTTVSFSVTGSNSTSGTSTTVNGQASFHYSGTLTGADTLTATATGGTTPSSSATITWGAPSSTKHASLTIVSPFSPSIVALVQTGPHGGTPVGRFTYDSRNVTLNKVQLTSLVATRSSATLYGNAQLADGTPVNFQLDVTTGRFSGTVRLRLSNGYDSGTFSVMAVRITP